MQRREEEIGDEVFSTNGQLKYKYDKIILKESNKVLLLKSRWRPRTR